MPSLPEGAVVLFDGKNLEGWVKLDGKTPANWPVAEGILTVGHGNIMTQKRFGDFQLHLEFNVPYMPNAHGQGRGNSGVYLTGNLRAPGSRLVQAQAPQTTTAARSTSRSRRR